VVETNVHFPADTSQLFDAIRKAIEVSAVLSEQQGSTQWRQFAHNIRGIKRKLCVVHKLKNSTSKKPEKKARKDQEIKQAHHDYLATVLIQLQRAVSTGADFGSSNPLLLSKLNHYVGHAEVQMDQIRRRVLNEEIIPHSEKVFSIFQPHTEWVSKGKAGVPVELGLKVCVIEDQYRFILHHQVMENVTDSDIAVSIIEETRKRFANLRAISYDKGFHSPDNQIELKKLLEKVVLPKKGKLSKTDKAHESEPEFRKLRRQHSAVESAINALEVHGLDICLDHGIKGFRRYVALAVLARNIHRFGVLLSLQDAKRHRGPYKKAA
jgi:transposase, IS5 family